MSGVAEDQSMNRILILFALALSAFTAGCQADDTNIQFPVHLQGL